MACAELALEAKNTLPPSFETHQQGNFPSPTSLPSTPRSPISNINRIRPAPPYKPGLFNHGCSRRARATPPLHPLTFQLYFCFRINSNELSPTMSKAATEGSGTTLRLRLSNRPNEPNPGGIYATAKAIFAPATDMVSTSPY